MEEDAEAQNGQNNEVEIENEEEEEDYDDYMYTDSEGEYEEEGGEIEMCVHQVKCEKCNAILSERAQSVVLVCDRSTKLYSTDGIDYPIIQSAEKYKINTCNCMIKDIMCYRCNTKVGYHVVEACFYCTCDSIDNSHYWLFNCNVKAEKIQNAFWAQLTANHSLPLIPKHCGLYFFHSIIMVITTTSDNNYNLKIKNNNKI